MRLLSIVLVMLFGGMALSHAQTTIWLEDFQDLADGTIVDNGATAWTSVKSTKKMAILNWRRTAPYYVENCKILDSLSKSPIIEFTVIKNRIYKNTSNRRSILDLHRRYSFQIIVKMILILE